MEHEGQLAAVAAHDVFVGRRDFGRVDMGRVLQNAGGEREGDATKIVAKYSAGKSRDQRTK